MHKLITFLSAYFDNLIFFQSVFVSSFFCFIILYPHEVPVDSYSYGKRELPVHCKHCLAYLSVNWSLVSSIFYLSFY